MYKNMFHVISSNALLRSISVIPNLQNISTRFIYNPAALGLDAYLITRMKHLATHKGELGERLREKMHEYSDPDNSSLVFTEDLKQIIHIAEATDEDVNLVKKMILKFNQQNERMRFGSYVFGPIVMRLFHHLNKPVDALELYMNDSLIDFFVQLSSNLILMDLLFKNEMYNEVIQVYDKICERQLQFGKYPKSPMILVFASFYKLNTEEGFKRVQEIWTSMRESGQEPLRRSACFAAGLAINQNAPHIALEMLTCVQKQNYILVRCLKALAYCAVGRVDDALPILKGVLQEDSPHAQKQDFTSDVLKTIKEAVIERDNKDIAFEFGRIEKQLIDQGHVIDKTFEELMCSEITVTPQSNRNQSIINASFQRGNNNYYKNPREPVSAFRRPGLTDLV